MVGGIQIQLLSIKTRSLKGFYAVGLPVDRQEMAVSGLGEANGSTAASGEEFDTRVSWLSGLGERGGG